MQPERPGPRTGSPGKRNGPAQDRAATSRRETTKATVAQASDTGGES